MPTPGTCTLCGKPRVEHVGADGKPLCYDDVKVPASTTPATPDPNRPPVAAICGYHHAANSILPASRIGCGKPIDQCADAYRCTDCGIPFHRECAKRHFTDIITAADAAHGEPPSTPPSQPWRREPPTVDEVKACRLWWHRPAKPPGAEWDLLRLYVNPDEPHEMDRVRAGGTSARLWQMPGDWMRCLPPSTPPAPVPARMDEDPTYDELLVEAVSFAPVVGAAIRLLGFDDAKVKALTRPGIVGELVEQATRWKATATAVGDAITFYRAPHDIEERHGKGECCCTDIAYALEAIVGEAAPVAGPVPALVEAATLYLAAVDSTAGLTMDGVPIDVLEQAGRRSREALEGLRAALRQHAAPVAPGVVEALPALVEIGAKAAHAAYREARRAGKLHTPEHCPCRNGHDSPDLAEIACSRCSTFDSRTSPTKGCHACRPALRSWEALTEAAREGFRGQARPIVEALRQHASTPTPGTVQDHDKESE